jgi:hypothetical protein
MPRVCLSTRTIFRVALLAPLGIGGGAVLAPPGAASPQRQEEPAQSPCVTVDIAGNRVGDQECRAQHMRETVRRAQQAAAATARLAQGAVPRGPAATGLATPAGASMRPSPLTGRTPPSPPVYASPIAPPR